ncbi:hypothetical protein [Oribacterium sp. WCC10]|uniref:hypothetical protein n=1 Tax=Oribacterium sp. WCC10 TaxID=1855343 RepID=UPI0008F0963A|nr:hypothetical protein [Oribacterium sp. WCC10]SFG60814.1 hypothetical protein SAMN05216356_114121 [Oribacterium sp. WCC10]
MEKPNSKGRILALLRYLQDETNEEHLADKKTIMKALQDKGYSITRNTLDDDIDLFWQEYVQKVTRLCSVDLLPKR